jgi:hypothetical protein
VERMQSGNLTPRSLRIPRHRLGIVEKRHAALAT